MSARMVRMKEDAEMPLEEVEVSAEINGEGQLSLFGSGGKVGTKGAILLWFKRKSSS